jgi:hypothetical protein
MKIYGYNLLTCILLYATIMSHLFGGNMKHIYSNTKEGKRTVDKIDSDAYLFQSALLRKQKKRSNHRFAITLFVALLVLLLTMAVCA